MNTVIIFDQLEADIKFFVVPGDHHLLDKVYINQCFEESKAKRVARERDQETLDKLLYRPDGSVCPDDEERSMSMDIENTSELSEESKATEERGLHSDALISAKALMLDPDFPTKDCLGPSTVALFAQYGSLTDDESLHAGSCRYCSAMLATLEPDQGLIEEFRAAVEQTPMAEVPQSRWTRFADYLGRIIRAVKECL